VWSTGVRPRNFLPACRAACVGKPLAMAHVLHVGPSTERFWLHTCTLGFLQGDKKAGPFKLEIEWIKVVRAGKAKRANTLGEKNSPAGPSSLAAYQTCRARVTFGRTAWRQPDTGRPPGLCTLTLSAGVTRRILAGQGTHRTETVVVVPVRRHIVVAVGRTDVRRLIVERTATQHTATRSSPSKNGLYQKDGNAGDRCQLAGRGRPNS
jgi:hypothetical protein